MKNAWRCVWNSKHPERDCHIVPVDDLREHDLIRSCWCQPRVLDDADCVRSMVSHHSLDGRELTEPDRDPALNPTVM